MIPVPEISDVQLAFPAGALKWMPAWEDIPVEFKDDTVESEWEKIARAWFHFGLGDKVEFYPREGVDPAKAIRAIKATLGSFEPKHEHKMAAVAFMLSEWFSKIKKWEKKK